MRLFLGMILGALLVVAAAYVHDMNAGDRRDLATRPIVNWDVVSQDWNHLRAGVRDMGDRIHNQWANR